jgi:hypothetical protein
MGGGLLKGILGVPLGGKKWERNGFTLWGRPWWEGMGVGLLKGILGVPLGGKERERNGYTLWGRPWWEGNGRQAAESWWCPWGEVMGEELIHSLGPPLVGRNGRGAAKGNPGGAPAWG